MKLIQQTENCSDFDVVLDGETSPAFRVLLPERIDTAAQSYGGTHTVPGVWQHRPNGIDGRFSIEDAWDVDLSLDTGGSEVRVDLTVRHVPPITPRSQALYSHNGIKQLRPWIQSDGLYWPIHG